MPSHLVRSAGLCSLALLIASIPCLSQPGVEAILPNGRQIRPAGNWIPLAPYPFAIALKPDGSQAAVPSIGFPFALNVIDNPASAAPVVRKMPSGENNDPAIETHAGLAYSPDGQTLYVATGDSGKIALYRTSDWHPISQVSLDAKVGNTEFTRSFAATVLLSADGRTLYALDQANWRVAVLDVSNQAEIKVVASIATGAFPFGEALSPDGARLYVTNTGLFEYTPIPGAKREDELGTGLKFPPFGYPSKEAREGTQVEGRTIPGLGDENSTRGSSLWTYDVHDPANPVKTSELRLGDRISETKNGDAGNGDVGGAAPTGVAADAAAVYVSLAHQDAIAKISPDGAKLLAQTPLSPFVESKFGKKFEDAQGRPLRGVMPSGLALAGGKLYAAESGIDAVAVLDTESMQVLEHIPAGWNPSAVVLSPDGQMLYIVNSKGKGAGPNGGKLHPEDAPSYVGSLEYGSLTAVNLATLPEAQVLTNQVLANNTHAIDNQPLLPHLKHCFLVIRENRTYDEILGDIATANGDPSLARYGLDGWAEEVGRHSRGGTKEQAGEVLDHLKVTPNLHSLAQHYAISDNFYVDSDVSADGHRWVVGINPTPFFNTAWTSGYGGRRSGDAGASQPGRRALFGGSDGPMPEDEPQFGSLWEHIADSGLGILNYGEGLEIEGNDELDGAAPEGQRLFLNAPVPKPVFESSDRRFPTFNLGIPDQFRFEEFKRDFTRRLAQGKIPGLIVIRLPNDHTADPRPADGYPYRASYVADNDLALGRIVAYLSKTSIWKDSVLFVTEDDAQGGVDHVDAHRSVLVVASPWVTAGSVSHQHSSMGSITRTINELLGVGALNLEDALAGELNGIFTAAPHSEAFAYQPSDTRVFDPAKARFAKPKTKQEAAELTDMDDAPKIQKQMENSKDQLRRPKPDKDND
jgi:YVTN family beta-propeller protein